MDDDLDEDNGEPETTGQRVSRLGLAAFMTSAAIGHFANPKFFDDIVPVWMPGEPRTTTYLSGVAELAAGSLLLMRRTAKLGGWTTLLVLIGVYPANVQMAIDTGVPKTADGWAIWVRLPLQIPLFAWAIRIARRS